MFWGLSEEINLPELYSKHINESAEHLNILLFGANDQRHILTALANSYKNNVKINFYVLEGLIENHARNILLLSVALEKPEHFSIKTKTHLYMDIYGNSLIRPFSYNYICSKSSHFSKIITDDEYGRKFAPIFNYEKLKYKERDTLDNIFEFWLNKKEHVFDIGKYWNLRLRALLGTRYDHRSGAFDWDLMMKLKDYGAKQICNQEYTFFRETGIAFTFPEYEQSCSNKSLAIGLLKNGNQYRHRGYLGDITVGPYLTFGNNCIDEKMLYSSHGVNQCRATDVTERNLYEIMFKIQEKQDYIHDPKNSHQYGSAVLENGKCFSDTKDFQSINIKQYNDELITNENITINLLSIEDCLKMGNIQKYFDIIFVGNNYFKLIKEDFPKLFNDKCLIIFETKQFSILKKEEISEFLIEIKHFCESINLIPITNFSINMPLPIVKYKYQSLK